MKRVSLFVPLFAVAMMATAGADEVTAWNEELWRLNLVVGNTPQPSSRVAAIVAASVFDAVNGIEGRYEPFHVAPAAPPGTSARAAAAQAAYTSLAAVFPAASSPLSMPASESPSSRSGPRKARPRSRTASRGATPWPRRSSYCAARMGSPTPQPSRTSLGEAFGARRRRRRASPRCSSPTWRRGPFSRPTSFARSITSVSGPALRGGLQRGEGRG